MKKLCVCLWFLLIFAAIALAFTPNIVKLQNGADKMLHVFITCSILLGADFILNRRKIVFMLAVLLLVAGGAIEIIQHILPDRQAEWEDLAANVIGVTLGLMIRFFIRSGYIALQQHCPKQAN